MTPTTPAIGRPRPALASRRTRSGTDVLASGGRELSPASGRWCRVMTSWAGCLEHMLRSPPWMLLARLG